MSPIDRAERICNEFGVCLAAVEGAPDVYESEELSRQVAVKLALALKRGYVAASGSRWVVLLDLSREMVEWRASEFDAQTGSAHL